MFSPGEKTDVDRLKKSYRALHQVDEKSSKRQMLFEAMRVSERGPA
jgi:hypothetical protein